MNYPSIDTYFVSKYEGHLLGGGGGSYYVRSLGRLRHGEPLAGRLPLEKIEEWSENVLTSVKLNSIKRSKRSVTLAQYDGK